MKENNLLEKIRKILREIIKGELSFEILLTVLVSCRFENT